MKRHVTALAALAVALSVLAVDASAQAQTNARSQAGPHTVLASPPPNASRQTLPAPASPPMASSMPQGLNDWGPSDGGDGCCDSGCCPSQCCPGECCPGECCESPCCGSCECNSCGNWGNWCNLCPTLGSPRPWFFTADYLYVRANFSEAVAFLEHVTAPSGSTTFTDTFHELDFQYQSSYRFGGGYKLPCCGEEIRFLFTRMSSSADTIQPGVDDTIIGPFETSPGPNGTLTAHGQVDTKSYDVEFAKTIPLGGCSTGCGDCCRPSCPAWDITWEGGFRFADVNWDRTYVGDNPDIEQTRTATANMGFQGGGPRFGVEGRRYFGGRQWFSAYLKGDISLLMGHVNVRDHRVTTIVDSPPDTIEIQTASFRNIVPVTEIEAGLTGQLTNSIKLNAGYLFSAWHDLGFRDEFQFVNSANNSPFLETQYDDANILGFDGFFARLEFDF
jgi:Legionella pneumophila major outer membrane protein precursor